MTDLPDYVMTADLEDAKKLPVGTIISWQSDPGVWDSRQVAILKRAADENAVVLEIGEVAHDWIAIPRDAWPVWVVWMPPTESDCGMGDYKFGSIIESDIDSARERALELAIEVDPGRPATQIGYRPPGPNVDAIIDAAEKFARFLQKENTDAH